MSRFQIRRGRWAAGALALVLLAGACGSSSKSSSSTGTTAPPVTPGTTNPTSSGPSPGITGNTITIGQIATVTGPVPGLFQGAFNGLDAWAAYVNSTGGIGGRTVKVVQKDDGLDCNSYTNDLNSLSNQVFSVVGTFTIEDTCGKTLLTSNPTFPDIQGYLLDPHLISLPNAFTPTPQPPGYFTTGAIWLKQKFPSAIGHSADLYSTLAKLSYEEISDTYKSEGFKYVYTRGTGPLETNFTSDILRMKSLGVRVVTLEAQQIGSIAAFIQQADQQGFHPDAIVAAQAYDAALFKTIGSADASNLYMPLGYPLYLGQDRSTNPALATFLDWLNRTHPGATPDLYTVEAWAAGQLFAQAMKSLGANPSRSDLINAVQQVHNFTADGLLPPTDPGRKLSNVCIVVAGVKGHQFVRLNPADKGYECNGTYNNIPLSQLGG
ncbi:MAG TPA: ABC transporter substrate-binding protein [Acidimicrobiales bacterium]